MHKKSYAAQDSSRVAENALLTGMRKVPYYLVKLAVLKGRMLLKLRGVDAKEDLHAFLPESSNNLRRIGVLEIALLFCVIGCRNNVRWR